MADKVELEDMADAEVKDTIQTIVVDGTNTGTITLMDGTVVIVTPETLMVDDRNNGMMPVQMFNLTSLAIGDYIEVDGHRDTVTGTITAYKLKRDDPGS